MGALQPVNHCQRIATVGVGHGAGEEVNDSRTVLSLVAYASDGLAVVGVLEAHIHGNLDLRGARVDSILDELVESHFV